MRIIVYTGKGGVGKTSVAAATALRAAELGYRTIVLSTDAAHSLGDSFDRPIGPEPVAVAPNLWVQEVDSRRQLERNWGKIRDYLTALFRSKQVGETLSEISVEELVVFPGLEELFCLLEIKRHHEEGRYDVIIMDCAPTGETLRLLSYPDLARWWLQRIFPVQRAVLKIARPVAQPLVSVPLPTVDVLDTVASFVRELEKMHALLTDTTQSSLRLVVNAEKMVIKEACRSFTYFNLFGFPTDLVVINRLLPAEVGDDYFRGWKDLQEKYVAVIEQSFAPLPIFRAPLFEHEVVGARSPYAPWPRAVLGRRTRPGYSIRAFPRALSGRGTGTCSRSGCPLSKRVRFLWRKRGTNCRSRWANSSVTSCCRGRWLAAPPRAPVLQTAC